MKYESERKKKKEQISEKRNETSIVRDRNLESSSRFDRSSTFRVSIVSSEGWLCEKIISSSISAKHGSKKNGANIGEKRRKFDSPRLLPGVLRSKLRFAIIVSKDDFQNISSLFGP